MLRGEGEEEHPFPAFASQMPRNPHSRHFSLSTRGAHADSLSTSRASPLGNDNSMPLHLILENPRGAALPAAEISSPLGQKSRTSFTEKGGERDKVYLIPLTSTGAGEDFLPHYLSGWICPEPSQTSSSDPPMIKCMNSSDSWRGYDHST